MSSLERCVCAAGLSAALAFACLSSPQRARAHLGSSKFIEFAEDGRSALVVIEVVDAAMELELGEIGEYSEVAPRRAAIEEWVLAGIRARSGERDCTTSAESFEPDIRDERQFIELGVRFECGGAAPVELRDGLVFEDDPQHEALVRLPDGGSRVLRAGRQTVSLEGEAGWFSLVVDYLWSGALHFALGYDHVLFLIALLLSIGRRASSGRIRDVVAVITAFTVGHSVTLVLAALSLVVLPSRPVEITIALSIALVAIWDAYRPSKRAPMPWAAFAFGLVHGFGFASVLLEAGLSTTRTALALGAFNVGIELAQLVCAALIIMPLIWLGRGEHGERRIRGVAIIIALAALAMVASRVFEGSFLPAI